MTTMAQVFLPTVNLTPSMYLSIVTDKVPLRTGQWVALKGRKGQYLTHWDGVISVSYSGKHDGFKGRTDRFCRAVWHHNHKHTNAAIAVLKAPFDITLREIKDAVRELFVRSNTTKVV